MAFSKFFLGLEFPVSLELFLLLLSHIFLQDFMLAFNFHNVWNTFIHLLLPFFFWSFNSCEHSFQGSLSSLLCIWRQVTPPTELQSTREREKPAASVMMIPAAILLGTWRWVRLQWALVWLVGCCGVGVRLLRGQRSCVIEKPLVFSAEEWEELCGACYSVRRCSCG